MPKTAHITTSTFYPSPWERGQAGVSGGLINMNGRLYDPIVGRMLSPDPYVPDGGYTQDFNRYSYARNNPLAYVDPDGEFPLAIMAFLLFSETGYEIQKAVLPVAVKFDLHLFGSDQRGFGVNISAGIPTFLPASYRWNFGATYYSKFHETEWQGWETRKGQEYGLLSGLYSASYTDFTMHEMEDFNQTTIRLKWGLPGLYASYENDYIHHDKFNFFRKISPNSIIHKGDAKEDRWRTAAVHLQIGPFSYGQKIVTGDPGPLGNRGWYTDENGQRYYTGSSDGKYNPSKYSSGIWYIGFGPLRLGGNSESFRNTWQNVFAHKPINAPYFPRVPRNARFFWYYGTGTGGTNW